MKLYVTALASGSNGNCYYIGNENEAILVDAGISCREIERRMKRLELSVKKLKAIFVSHEHTDHVKGVHMLSKKYSLPVFITPGTLANSSLGQGNAYNQRLATLVPVQIGDLEVTAFPKLHDAKDPQSFVIRHRELCVGVFTDIGMSCAHVEKYFSCCHAIFLEANYDDKMLQEGPYPYFLKRRISGGKGHLSNQQALDLFLKHKPSYMSHVFLSHLSKDNNCPELAFDLFKAHSQGVEIVLTSRASEIPVYEIRPDMQIESPSRQKPVQINLFD